MANFKHTLFGLYSSFMDDPFEENAVKSLIRKHLSEGLPILDVGCGYGRYLKPLQAMGYNTFGIDLNPKCVADLTKEGFKIATDIDNFGSQKFSCILMSHVVEHLQPADLYQFLDKYLSVLAPDGVLIISTPLMSPYFYDDFDHVKPYQPLGISMLFDPTSQMQYHSKNRLDLIDLKFRRSAPRWNYHASLYVASSKTRVIPFTINLFFRVLHRLTFRAVGTTDGWIGAFKKIE